MASNYTNKEVQTLLDIYLANPCLEVVDQLSVKLNKPRKSIIAKLVKEGVYVTRGYRTKTGETPITKLELVRAIEDCLDVDLNDLDKTPKNTLKKLKEAVVEQTSFLEKTLAELTKCSEELTVLRQMSSKKSLQNSIRNDDPISILEGVDFEK